MNILELEKAIKEDNINLVELGIKENLVDVHDHSFLNLALSYQSFHSFIALIKIIHIEQKEHFFIKCISSSLPLALAFLENNNFEDNAHMIEYEHYWTQSSFFTDESQLPRYYQPLCYKNNKEAFLAQLVYASLRTVIASDFEALTYLIENRKLFNISDEHIIQYFVEGNYEFKENTNQFCQIIELLIKNKVDFSSDKLGFLIQIAAINNIYNTIYSIALQGSSIEGFLNRYHDKNQWLTPAEQDILYENDYNNDRTYDIYKKFDEDNFPSLETIEEVNIILNYEKMNNTLPLKLDSSIKVKI